MAKPIHDANTCFLEAMVDLSASVVASDLHKGNWGSSKCLNFDANHRSVQCMRAFSAGFFFSIQFTTRRKRSTLHWVAVRELNKSSSHGHVANSMASL